MSKPTAEEIRKQNATSEKQRKLLLEVYENSPLLEKYFYSLVLTGKVGFLICRLPDAEKKYHAWVIKEEEETPVEVIRTSSPPMDLEEAAAWASPKSKEKTDLDLEDLMMLLFIKSALSSKNK